MEANKVSYRDTVKIDHPEIEGIGIVTRFHNDEVNGVQVEILECTRKSNGKKVKSGQRFNCLQEYLTTIKSNDFKSSAVITEDALLAELFDSEEKRDEAIGVFTPEFTGRWVSA